mmetsp:Transcript_8056/g.19821  ORF Transcript_8056/g.19821 Transcript_8056/m.19821 type:complete len:327 (-) Transcript_8056:74-1054(-)
MGSGKRLSISSLRITPSLDKIGSRIASTLDDVSWYCLEILFFVFFLSCPAFDFLERRLSELFELLVLCLDAIVYSSSPSSLPSAPVLFTRLIFLDFFFSFFSSLLPLFNGASGLAGLAVVLVKLCPLFFLALAIFDLVLLRLATLLFSSSVVPALLLVRRILRLAVLLLSSSVVPALLLVRRILRLAVLLLSSSVLPSRLLSRRGASGAASFFLPLRRTEDDRDRDREILLPALSFTLSRPREVVAEDTFRAIMAESPRSLSSSSLRMAKNSFSVRCYFAKDFRHVHSTSSRESRRIGVVFLRWLVSKRLGSVETVAYDSSSSLRS